MSADHEAARERLSARLRAGLALMEREASVPTELWNYFSNDVMEAVAILSELDRRRAPQPVGEREAAEDIAKLRDWLLKLPDPVELRRLILGAVRIVDNSEEWESSGPSIELFEAGVTALADYIEWFVLAALASPGEERIEDFTPLRASPSVLASTQSRTLEEPDGSARAIHYEEADVLEWIVRDVPAVARATDAGDILLDMKTREPIGWRIYNWSKRAPLEEPESAAGALNAVQIKHMVDRFLGWRLPADFNPDNGISYQRPNYAPSVDATPTGTNLFSADQAHQMVRYMLEGLR